MFFTEKGHDVIRENTGFTRALQEKLPRRVGKKEDHQTLKSSLQEIRRLLTNHTLVLRTINRIRKGARWVPSFRIVKRHEGEKSPGYNIAAMDIKAKKKGVPSTRRNYDE